MLIPILCLVSSNPGWKHVSAPSVSFAVDLPGTTASRTMTAGQWKMKIYMGKDLEGGFGAGYAQSSLMNSDIANLVRTDPGNQTIQAILAEVVYQFVKELHGTVMSKEVGMDHDLPTEFCTVKAPGKPDIRARFYVGVKTMYFAFSTCQSGKADEFFNSLQIPGRSAGSK